MNDCRGDHFQRLGTDETAIERAGTDSRIELCHVTGDRYNQNTFNIPNKTIVAHPIVCLYQTKRLLYALEIELLTGEKSDPQPIDAAAITQTQ
jgi:hypothetical protein